MKSQTYTIIPTEKFNKELHQQILYVAMQFSKETAIQVKENIQNSISNLMNHPYMGGTTPKIRALNDSDFRMLILEKLIIVYTVVEETRTIYLISILDQRQDYVNILNGL
nr:type II toxin-antitoxin system RelE/ParE family toxin [Veillonella denticariosi]